MTGKTLRLQRLFCAPTGRTAIVPLDHTLSMGLLAGLDDLPNVVELAGRCGADAVILRPGAVRHVIAHDPTPFDGMALVVHLSGATSLSPTPTRQMPLASVEDAVRLGADCVSVQLNLGGQAEPEMLAMVGRVARASERFGMPLLVMAYVRDDTGTICLEADKVLHAARVAEELGADVIKIPYPGQAAVARLTHVLRSPVLVAGGPRTEGPAVLDMVGEAVRAGAAGVCIGRNVFQAARPDELLRGVCAAVHEPTAAAWKLPRGA